jgi:hypothetical protein
MPKLSKDYILADHRSAKRSENSWHENPGLVPGPVQTAWLDMGQDKDPGLLPQTSSTSISSRRKTVSGMHRSEIQEFLGREK